MSRLNRRLAAAGEPVVTEAPGTFVLPSLRLRRLVTLLDGTRGPDTLLEELVADLPPDERELPDAAWLRRQLETLAAHALLTA